MNPCPEFREPVHATTRPLWPDLVRVVALLAVIVLHVAAVPVTHFGDLPRSSWWWANAYDSFARPCIPLFVMLSGALLLTTPEWHRRSFVRNRVRKVVVPFIAWSAIYAGWNHFLNDAPVSLARFGWQLVGGMADPVYPHLWYLPLILSLYLLVPLVRTYAINASRENQLYFIALWLIATVINPSFESAWGKTVGYYLQPVFGFIGYFMLGATIWTFGPGRLATRWLAIAGAVFLVGYIITVFGTYALTAADGELNETYYSNLAPNVILMSVSAFVLLRHLGIRLQQRSDDYPRIVSFVTLASGVSFGAYLIHMIVLEVLSYGLLGFVVGPMSGRTSLVLPSISIFVLLVSLGLAALLRRSRLLLWLVP